MSVQMNIYVMYGVLLPYSTCEELYEHLEPYMEKDGKDGVSVVYDGMNGQYVAVGHVLAISDDYCGFEEPIQTCTMTREQQTQHELAALRLLNEIKVAPPLRGFQWMVISHYR